MATLSIKQKFNSIKQDKISDQAKKALQLMKEATDNFKDEEAVAKIRPKFDALFEKIKIAKPEAIVGESSKESKKAPTPSQTKSVRSAASSLSLTAKKRILEAKKERARQGITTKKSDILKDGKIKAIKKTGRRVSQGLKGNQFADKSQAKGNVYYEYRNNRYDKQPNSKPRLEKGGMMARGGEIKKEDVVILGVPRNKITEKEWQSILRMAKYQDGATYILKDEKGLDVVPQVEYEWYLKEKISSGGMMADGGRISKGVMWRMDWKTTDGKEGYDILEVVDTKYFSNNYQGGIVVRSKIIDSSKKEHIGEYSEDHKDFLKKVFSGKYPFARKLASGGMMAKGGEMHRVNEG